MPIYEHSCRECSKDWHEQYSLETFDKMKAEGTIIDCPYCGSKDTYRAVGHIPVHFKPGGVGWADSGYNQYGAYENRKAQGQKVELFERREDLQRVMKGEKAEAMKKRLKREDELAKKYFGPDAAMSQAEADKRIKKEVDKVVS